MELKYKATVALIIALSELALLPVLLSIGGKEIGTVTELFYAFAIGSVVSLSVSYMKDRMRGLVKIIKSNELLLIVIVAGLLNDVISQLLLGVGTVGTNPIVAATIFRSWVIMAALLVPLTLRQKVKKVQLLALVIGFMGVYLLASNGTLLSVNLVSLPFILILLGSALCSVYPNLAMKKYNVDVIGAIAIFNVASFVFIAALALLTNTTVAIPFTFWPLFVVVFLGTATYGIGTALYYYSLKAFGPLFVGNSILVVPFFTIVLSFLLLGTPVYPYYVIAAVLLSVGILVQQKFAKAPEHISSKGFAQNATVFDVSGALMNNKDATLSRYLSGSNKALALKFNGRFDLNETETAMFDKYGCLVFSTKGEYTPLADDELKFINEMIGATNSDTIIVGIGNSDKLDKSFSELMRQR